MASRLPNTLSTAGAIVLALSGAAGAATLNFADLSLSGGSLGGFVDNAAVPSSNVLTTVGSATLSLNLLSGSTFEVVYNIGTFPGITATQITLTDLVFDSAANVTGASLTSGDGALASVSTTATSITVDLANYFVPPNTTIETWQFAFTTTDAELTPVPLPAGFALLLTAVGGLATVRRRKA